MNTGKYEGEENILYIGHYVLYMVSSHSFREN